MNRPRSPPRNKMFHVKQWKEFFMKNRAPTNRNIDRKIFRYTATKVKAVNLPQKNYRGGIRF